MKNLVLTLKLLLALLFVASCHSDDVSDCRRIVEMESDTHVSVRAIIGLAAGETLTVTSMRVIIFCNKTGNYITHGVFRFPADTEFTAGSSQEVIINGKELEFSIPTIAGESYVFVIFNEGDVETVSGDLLSDRLRRIGNMPSPLTSMHELLATPLRFNELIESGDREPPFIMVTQGVFVVKERYTADEPFLLNFTGTPSSGINPADEAVINQPLERSMAKVTITGVTSRLPGGQNRTPEQLELLRETSRIFILDMGLVNVPQFYWAVPRDSEVLFHAPLSFNRQDDRFQQGNPENDIPHFSRTWDGDMTITVTSGGRVRQTQRLRDGRIWWHANNMGQNSYSFDRSALDRQFFTPSGIDDLALQSHWGAGGVEMPSINSGNFLNFYRIHLSRPVVEDDFLPPTFEFLDTESHQLVSNVNGGEWTLNTTDISFYIPENLFGTNATTATSLFVKAAVASPPTTIKGYEIEFDNNMVNWGSWQYAQSTGGSNINAVTSQMVIAAWGYEEDVIIDSQGRTVPIIRHFWDLGILRWRDGTFRSDITLSPENYPDIEFKITLDNKRDARMFIIPIAPTAANPTDFVTRRNHEYRFSVHATEPWWSDGFLPESRALRSTNGASPFMLQRMD